MGKALSEACICVGDHHIELKRSTRHRNEVGHSAVADVTPCGSIRFILVLAAPLATSVCLLRKRMNRHPFERDPPAERFCAAFKHWKRVLFDNVSDADLPGRETVDFLYRPHAGNYAVKN